MLPLVGQLLAMLVQGIEAAPSIIAAAKAEYDALVNQTPVTPEQQAAIDAALAASEAALQAT
jgi:hypothetical protein